MTTYALHGDNEKGISVGMDDYIAKPVQKGALVEALRRCSHKAQWDPPYHISSSDLDWIVTILEHPSSMCFNLYLDLD